jgi:hypothetical protein
MFGGSKFIRRGDREPVSIQLFNRYVATPLTGKIDIFIKVRRVSDDFFLDWSDNTFKDPGTVTTLRVKLSEVSLTYSPGVYELDYAPTHLKGLDTGAITNAADDDVYDVMVEQVGGTDAGGLPTGYELHLSAYQTNLPAYIADAVWDELQADHKAVGTFGDLMRRIVALQKEHYVIDNMVHNTQGLLTSARIRLFENKADVLAATDGGSGEGEFATYSFQTTPDAVKPVLADVVKSVRDS